MANALFDHGRENFLAGNLDWDGSDIKLHGVDEDDDVPDLANDEDLVDRAAAARVGTSGNFVGKTVAAGTADATDVTVATVAGDEFESIDIYYDSTVEATSLLICNIDTATGLPCTPNGGDIIYQWDAGADRIFTL